MITLKRIEENSKQVIDGLCRRGLDRNEVTKKIETIIENNKLRKKYKKETDEIAAELNKKTKEIETIIKSNGNVEECKKEVFKSKEEYNIKKQELDKLEREISTILYNTPNVPSEDAPLGKNCEDNKVVFQTDIPTIANPLPHYEIIKKLGIVDFELGVKIAGAGFPVYKGFGARLQRALINFFLDEAVKNGFVEHELPIVCNDASCYGTGQMPDKENQMYKVDDEFHLIPTAEVPLTNLYRDVIIDEDSLPIKITGYTPCFRREAGSWGKNVRGLNRLHQFDKIEIVQIVKPENSYFVLEEMRSYVEGLVRKLELPYRVLALCTGDLGFNAAFTYDIEVFSLGQNMWLEASSITNFEEYQANRMKLRYKTKEGEKILAHTLNGSALALPRIVAALIEKGYDGEKINLPKVLDNYI